MEFAKIRVSGVRATPACLHEIPRGITGATVRFEYTDPMWDGLTKTVVFQGAETRDVVNAGGLVVIPAEVVAKAGVILRVGVWGTGADNNIAIPTLWADLGRIRASALPSGNEPSSGNVRVEYDKETGELTISGAGTGYNASTGELTI